MAMWADPPTLGPQNAGQVGSPRTEYAG